MLEIRAWINGTRNYDTGLLLYSKFGNIAEPDAVVRSVTKLLVSNPNADKLLKKMLALYEHTRNNIAHTELPEAKTQPKPTAQLNRVSKGKIIVPIKATQKTNHYINGTANVMSKNGGLRKIHLRLIESVNGKSVILGSGGFEQIGFRDMLKLFYSGQKLDLVICKYNGQLKTGGERMKLDDCVISQVKDWFEPQQSIVGNSFLSAECEKTLAELRNRWVPLYSEMSSAHAKMCAIDDTNKRFDFAKKIMELQAECQNYWQAQNHIYKYGCLPDAWVMPKLKQKAAEVITIEKMRKDYDNLKSLISKYRTKVKNGKDGAADTLKELENKRVELKNSIANYGSSKTNGAAKAGKNNSRI